MKTITTILTLILAGAFFSPSISDAQVIKMAFPLEMESWEDVNKTDGPITIHRVRMSKSEVGIRSKLADEAPNREYLERVGFQMEYTNDGGRNYRSFINVRLLDSEGKPIDGFGDRERLESEQSRDLVSRSFAANKYAIAHATQVEFEIKLNP